MLLMSVAVIISYYRHLIGSGEWSSAAFVTRILTSFLQSTLIFIHNGQPFFSFAPNYTNHVFSLFRLCTSATAEIVFIVVCAKPKLLLDWFHKLNVL